MGLDTIEVKEMSLISSMMDDIKVLRTRIEEMEERLQMQIDLHSESEVDVREEYSAYLDDLEEKGKFEDFANIRGIEAKIEKAEN